MTNELSGIEHELEQTRENLAANIDQLVYRLNPKTIVGRQVETTRSHFVDPATGEPNTDNILKVAMGVAGVVVVLLIIRKIVK